MGKSETFPFDKVGIAQVMDSLAKLDQGDMYADQYSEQVYTNVGSQKDSLYWVTPWGIDERAENLIAWLQNVEGEGLSRACFRLDEIEDDLLKFRVLRPDSCTQEEVTELMGRLEYRLMRAYFRYAYGQRYGYTRMVAVLNNAIEGTGASYKNVSNIEPDEPTDSLGHEAVKALSDKDDMDDFLHDQQPVDSMFYRMCRAFQKAQNEGDTARASLARVNIERRRWRYARHDALDRYVFVNLPSFRLQAYDRAQEESLLDMKICCGQVDHKTPLLSSGITRLELNPYWNVPYSIIKNELAPAHAGDAAYYNRNHMVAIDKQTGAELDAASLSQAQLLSGRYSIRQERGAGNSLGRLIFRFPNPYSVYLHDTSSPAAFGREVRTVSHGCIRLEKPLGLAVFLCEKDEMLVDKIRIAIDKAPLTDKGRKYKEETEEENYMHSYRFKPEVPVFIDYYTLYPDAKGEMKAYKDVYGYDKAIQRMMDKF